MITNNIDLYNYMTNRGVWCTYFKHPPKVTAGDELVIVFPTCHNMTVCGNRFNKEKEVNYIDECHEMIDWLECGTRVICITPVIKFDSEYMRRVATTEYERLQNINYDKQIIHTKNIGELLVPHRLQIRYKGVKPIEFDYVNTHMLDYHHYWSQWRNDSLVFKHQQQHYLNVINASHDTETRRKLRYIPEYTLFSQLYKKLYL